MAQKSKIRTIEWLSAIDAVDKTERIIRAKEKIEVYCKRCKCIGCATIGNIDYCLKTKGYGWQCSDCFKVAISESASTRIGEKNSFFGKIHSGDTKKTLSKKATARIQSYSPEKRKRIARKAINAAYNKYNGNPMHNDEVKQRHHDSVHTEIFIENARQLGTENALNPDFNKKMSEYSKTWWSSQDGSLQKLKMRLFYQEQFNKEGGKYYEIRKKTMESIDFDARQIKMIETSLKKYGVRNPMQSPEIRRKAFSKKGKTGPEKIIFEMLLQRGLVFEYEKEINGKFWDFVIYDEGMPKLVIEVDGEYVHGLLNDSNGYVVGGHKDNERFPLIPEGTSYLEVDSKNVKNSISEIMRLLGVDYSSWIAEIFQECSKITFPYPEYNSIRMMTDWKNLKKSDPFVYSPKNLLGNSIITNFCRSIYTSRCYGRPSPVEAWYSPELLLKCIENRFIYKSNLSTQQIARGFEKNKIAPRVTVFQPSLTRYLINNYAPDSKSCIDPFLGFSGRLLGAVSLGLSYTGYDIRQETINEASEVVNFLGLENVRLESVDIENLVDNNEYDVLITCPPYENKEIWVDNQKCYSADYYIELCLSKIKAKKYIFIVDKTVKFKDKIKRTLSQTSHISSSSELVLVFE